MSKNLTKAEVASIISSDLGLSDETAKATLNVIIKSIQEALIVYKEVTLTDFGGVPITIKYTQKTKSQETSTVPDPGQKLSDESKPGHEARKLKRRNFVIDLEIVDMDTGQTLGDIGDITTEGLMIVSEEPIEEKRVFRFKVVTQEDLEENINMEFSAKSIRCQKTIHEHIYTTGFLIENLDQENFNRVSTLINSFAV